MAEACETHYSPLGPSDDVPSEPVAVAVSLAEKIDILTGFWAIDEKPTGSKDPFALRRAALGVIRTILTNDVRARLIELFAANAELARQLMARDDFHKTEKEGEADDADLLSFFADRLKVHLRGEGVRHDVIDACFQLGGQDLSLIHI